MSGAVRLGAVSYLNTRPLVHGLSSDDAAAGGPDIRVRFDVPAVCFDLLATRDIDLGLIPSITYAMLPGLQVVPGIGILSDGPVASVAIFSKVPIARVRTLALDTSSRTSAALTRILCDRVFGIAPSFHPHTPDLADMLATFDAALLIGDPALFVDARQIGAEKTDLGETWTAWTGLPFVWAFWAGRSDAVDGAVVRRLREARDRGVAASTAIANAYCPDDAAKRALAREYLQHNIYYDMNARALAGLSRFYTEAAALKIIDAPPEVRFFAE